MPNDTGRLEGLSEAANPSGAKAPGPKVKDRTLANKISAGGFSAVFFLQCMEAIGARNIFLGDIDEQGR